MGRVTYFAPWANMGNCINPKQTANMGNWINPKLTANMGNWINPKLTANIGNWINLKLTANMGNCTTTKLTQLQSRGRVWKKIWWAPHHHDVYCSAGGGLSFFFFFFFFWGGGGLCLCFCFLGGCQNAWGELFIGTHPRVPTTPMWSLPCQQPVCQLKLLPETGISNSGPNQWIDILHLPRAIIALI